MSDKESLEDMLSLQDEVLVQLGLTEQSQVGRVKDIELSLDEYEVRGGVVAGIWLKGLVDVFLQSRQCHYISVDIQMILIIWLKDNPR